VGGLRAGVGQLPGVQWRGVGPGLGGAVCTGSTPEILAQGQAAAAGRGCRCATLLQRPCNFAASCTIFSALTIGFSAQHLDVQLRVVTGERVMSAGSAAGTKPNESPPAAGKRGRGEAAAANVAALPAATETASPKSAKQQGRRRSGASAQTLKDSQNPDDASPQRPAETAAAPAGSRAASRRAAAVPQGERSTPTPDAARAAALGLRVKRQRTAAPSPDTAADAKQPETAVQQEQSTGNVDGLNKRKSGNRRSGGRADAAAAAEEAEPRGTPAVEPRRRSGRR
jgi:hypothetical protein